MAEEQEVCTKLSRNVKMAGFLEKKGSMLWKRYWFVLEGQLLLFYKTQSEYINLSPCRGSVNMGLVSTVQPRRNSKEHVIHVVSRFNSLVLLPLQSKNPYLNIAQTTFSVGGSKKSTPVLYAWGNWVNKSFERCHKAKDRQTQEKWLQALLDSIGKQGVPTKYSLENLRDGLETATLPRRLHGGSLDAVWSKGPILPKTKMLDKVSKYDEDPDENQNLDVYSSLEENQRKSLTLDSRSSENFKMSESTLGRLRSAITGRKSSTSSEKPERSRKPSRNESFIFKMFRRGSSSGEVHSTADPEPEPEPSLDTLRVESPEGSSGTKTPDVPVTDSDLDDPLYDKIKPSKVADDNRLAGRQILLPAGTLAELKNRLRSKESLDGEDSESRNVEPPALPPRHSGNFETVEAVVHVASADSHNDSEESEVSGNYQVIRKPAVSFEIPNNPLQITEVDYSDDSETSGHYQKIRKPAPLGPNEPTIVSETPKEVSVPETQGTDLPEVSVPETQETDLPEPLSIPKTASLLWNTMDSLNPPEPPTEVEYQVVNLEMKKKHRQSKELKKVTPGESFLEDILPEITPEKVIVAGLYPALVETGLETGMEDTFTKVSEDSFDSLLGLCESMKRTSQDRTPAPARKSQDFTTAEPTPEPELDVGMEIMENLLASLDTGGTNKYIAGDNKDDVDLEKINDTLETLEEKTEDAKKEMEKGMSELNQLLGQLSKMALTPILPKTPSPDNKEEEDPDYDIPRPHIPILNCEAGAQDRIRATEFFNQVENSSSLEPDSLESKKEG